MKNGIELLAFAVPRRSAALVTVDGAGNGLTATATPAVIPAGTTSSEIVVAAAANAAPGTRTLTVRAIGAGVAAQAAPLSVAVTAAPVPVATVEVSLGAEMLVAGQTTIVTATVRDGMGNLLTGRQVTYATSDGAVASVSASGQVTAARRGRSPSARRARGGMGARRSR